MPWRASSNPRQTVELHQTGTFEGRSSDWAKVPRVLLQKMPIYVLILILTWGCLQRFFYDLFNPDIHVRDTLARSFKDRKMSEWKLDGTN